MRSPPSATMLTALGTQDGLGQLAERDCAPAGTLRDFAYLYLDDGMGCAIVSDGEVRRGSGGLAGEVAHLITAGPQGRAMHLIDVFGELGLRRAGSTAIDAGRLLTVISSEQPQAAAVRRTLGQAIGGVLTAVVALSDPELVVIGGSWGTHPLVLDAVTTAFTRMPRHVALRAAKLTFANARESENSIDHVLDGDGRLRDPVTRRFHRGSCVNGPQDHLDAKEFPGRPTSLAVAGCLVIIGSRTLQSGRARGFAVQILDVKRARQHRRDLVRFFSPKCCRRCWHLSFEVKYGAQRDVDLHEFLRVQAARELTEALRVDGGGLLDQYPDILAEELDGGMDHGSEGLGRRRGHKPR